MVEDKQTLINHCYYELKHHTSPRRHHAVFIYWLKYSVTSYILSQFVMEVSLMMLKQNLYFEYVYCFTKRTLLQPTYIISEVKHIISVVELCEKNRNKN